MNTMTKGVLLAVLLLSGCTSADESLTRLLDDEWQRGLRDNPIAASWLGDGRFNDRWPDESLEAITARHDADRAVLERLNDIARDSLSPTQQLNYDLFEHDLQARIAGHRFREFLMPLTALDGVQLLNEITEVLPMATAKDYQDWCARLESFPTLLEQTETLMRAGLKEGRVMPQVTMTRVPPQLVAQIVSQPEASPFFSPFKKMPSSLAAAEREALIARGTAAIADKVVPAFRRFQSFFVNEYLPNSRSSLAATALPDGADYYAWRAQRFTTTAMTPEQIHAVGLSEVARIRREMNAVMRQTGFQGDFAAFLKMLRTDSRFYYRSRAELLDGYRVIAKKLDGELPKLFGKLPRLPYGVREVAPVSAPSAPAAYYYPGALDGTRAGFFYANTYKPETRPKWEMEALTAHEGVPGHHFQIALAQELGELPPFRRNAGYTAFVEGWGLYAESLGSDLGLYQDPYSKFGQLTFEMWRAIRLVVDTGVHAKGWTREQAVQFFLDNAGKSRHDIEVEVDRYIVWPGQALAYKIGELKIKELRARAEKALGERFDIRRFHDEILGRGALPLDVLERQIDAYIASVQ